MSPASALHPPRANVSADLLSVLSDLLLRVNGGPVVLLRPLPDDFDFHRDDVDLLLTERQRTQLLMAAFEASAGGKIHSRIRQGSVEKTQLILWNLNCTSSLSVDLWSAFSQLPNYRGRRIPADLLRGIPESDASCSQCPSSRFASALPGTIRLPADIDFCLLVLHLASKRKPLSHPVVRERLFLAYERLKLLSLDEAGSSSPNTDIAILLKAAAELPDLPGISLEQVRDAEAYLLNRIGDSSCNLREPILQSRESRSLRTNFGRWLMKRVPCLAIVGSDGAGKSSVSQSLVVSQQSITEYSVGKKLYRRSLLYRLVSGASKRIVGMDRGRFDDCVAGWITLRASVSLWLRFAVRSTTPSKNLPAVAGLPTAPPTEPRPAPPPTARCKTLILDRSIASFLIRDRKTDTPRLHWSARLLERWIPPVTTVLLTVPFEQLAVRKQEMSCQGHQRYQRLLFLQALRQQPSDVIVVANTQSADNAARAICLIRSDWHVPDVMSAMGFMSASDVMGMAEETAA